MIPIYRWKNLNEKDKNRILKRFQSELDTIQEYVRAIIQDVKKDGDRALEKYTQKFDDPNFNRNALQVTEKDIQNAYKKIDAKVLKIIREQIAIAKKYAENQKKSITTKTEILAVQGVITGLRWMPIESVGLYVPAGKAPLPTVAQILTITAKVAGVKRIVVCFPATGEHKEIIVAAKEAGADEIYRVGGVQAIAAMAFGTESIKRVNFIAGPGNPYVQAAKLQVFGQVGIDMLSGPSEVLIMADDSANPVYLAADMLAQLEHGPDSTAVLVTNSQKIARETQNEIKKQAPKQKRRTYIQEALKRYSAILITDSLDEMIKISNDYSPEHLEIQVENPQKLLQKIRNAGSIFLGKYAPVAVGDYASGTNHCLPTGTAVKYASPVNIQTFMKASAYQYLTKKGLQKLKPIVETISNIEGLYAHNYSLTVRFQ